MGEERSVFVELELRISLNMLFKFCEVNFDEPLIMCEICQVHIICLEEICMRAIKYSLETP